MSETGVFHHEAYFPAQPPPSQENSRFPDPYGDEEWTAGVEAPTRKGAQAADRILVLARAGAMSSHPFSKAQRVRQRGEFKRVFDTGYRVSSRYFTLVLAQSEAPPARLGIVASRKLGDAVRRNRAKRLIREMFRHLETPAAGVDVVVIPRRELFDAPFTDLERDFQAAWRRGVSRLQPQHAG